MTTMMVIGALGLLLFGLAVGYILATYVIARDPNLVKLEKDEMIVKRPSENLVLAAVTPEILRRIVTTNGRDPSGTVDEARNIYRKS